MKIFLLSDYWGKRQSRGAEAPPISSPHQGLAEPSLPCSAHPSTCLHASFYKPKMWKLGKALDSSLSPRGECSPGPASRRKAGFESV